MMKRAAESGSSVAAALESEKKAVNASRNSKLLFRLFDLSCLSERRKSTPSSQKSKDKKNKVIVEVKDSDDEPQEHKYNDDDDDDFPPLTQRVKYEG